MLEVDAFGTDRCRDDRLSHRHPFQDFEARAAPNAQRNYRYSRPSKVRPQILNPAGNFDARLTERKDLSRMVLAEDLHASPRVGLGDQGQDLAQKVKQPIGVGEIIARAKKDDRKLPSEFERVTAGSVSWA